MLKLQYPTKVGDFIGCLDVTSVADTSWHDLQSQNFKSSTTGTAVPTSLPFSEVTVYNGGSSNAFFKLRARGGAGDTTTDELVVLSGGVLSFQVQGMSSGDIFTVSYKKTVATDSLTLLCSFVKKGE